MWQLPAHYRLPAVNHQQTALLHHVCVSDWSNHLYSHENCVCCTVNPALLTVLLNRSRYFTTQRHESVFSFNFVPLFARSKQKPYLVFIGTYRTAYVMYAIFTLRESHRRYVIDVQCRLSLIRPISLFVCPPPSYQPVWLPAVFLCVCVSVCLCLSVHLCLCLSLYLPVYFISACLYICL